MIWILDDRHLSSLLRGNGRPEPVEDQDRTVTTGYWYVRLCQAVLGASPRPGALSSPFVNLPANLHDRAVLALLRLPPSIELVSLRELAPVIGRLRARHSLNILGMEALAASVHLAGGVVLSSASPRLEAALAAASRPAVVCDP